MLKLSALVRLLNPWSLRRGMGLTMTWDSRGPDGDRRRGLSAFRASAQARQATQAPRWRQAFEIARATAYKSEPWSGAVLSQGESHERAASRCQSAPRGRDPQVAHAGLARARRGEPDEVPLRLPSPALPDQDGDLPPGRPGEHAVLRDR